jgi:transposase
MNRKCVKYVVTLTQDERNALRRLVSVGRAAARKLTHARILLQADSGPSGAGDGDAEIGATLGVGHATIERVRQRFVEEGLEAALERRRSRRAYRRKLDGRAEARLIAVACSRAPAGRSRWTLRLLAEQLVVLEVVDAISHECVRETLKKTNLSLG